MLCHLGLCITQMPDAEFGLICQARGEADQAQIECFEAGVITIAPLDLEQVAQASVDLHIGPRVLVADRGQIALDVRLWVRDTIDALDDHEPSVTFTRPRRDISATRVASLFRQRRCGNAVPGRHH